MILGGSKLAIKWETLNSANCQHFLSYVILKIALIKLSALTYFGTEGVYGID